MIYLAMEVDSAQSFHSLASHAMTREVIRDVDDLRRKIFVAE